MSKSLEALNDLKWHTVPTDIGIDHQVKCEETIKKDLEVLEILRPHLINAGIGKFDNVEDNEIFHLKLTFSGKEYKQLEEWLNGEGQV